MTFARCFLIIVATLAIAGVALVHLPGRGPFPPHDVVAPGREDDMAVSSLAKSVAWTQPLDTSSLLERADFWEPALAVGRDQIVFRSGGRICAFRIADGRRRWCAGAGGHPVFASDRFAYITNENAVEAVDYQSGAHRWTFRFHIDPKLTLPGARTFVWVFSDTLVAASYARTDAAHVPYAVLSTAGETRWVGRDQDAVHGPLVELSPGRVLIPQQGSGAYLVMPWRLLFVEPISSFGPSFASATAFLGRRAGLVFADPNSFAPVNERLTSFRVRIDDESGRTLQGQSYRPRLIGPQSGPCATTCEGEAVAIDHSFVYGRIHDMLYRFPWGKSDADSSVSLGEATSFAGRTSGGALIVTRSDGTWLIDSSENAVRSDRLRKDHVVLHRRLAELDVLGFAGGEVIVVDARNREIAERSGCLLLDAVRVNTRVMFACGAPNAHVDALVIQR